MLWRFFGVWGDCGRRGAVATVNLDFCTGGRLKNGGAPAPHCTTLHHTAPHCTTRAPHCTTRARHHPRTPPETDA